MWQLLLLAAAAAGSTGLVAKYLLSPCTHISEGDHNEKEGNPFDDDVKYQSPVVQKASNASGYETNCENQAGIFRFSSAATGGKSGSKNMRKKKKQLKSENKSGDNVESRKRRVVAVYLKKRRTSKNGAGKRGARSSKDTSLFNWGLGVGIMCMMSAGKAEISKLNTTMDATAKIVQDLKSVLDQRKASRSMQVLSSCNEVTENSEKNSNKQTQQVLSKSRSRNRGFNDQTVLGFPIDDDGECNSSILTEEQDAEIMEMDLLEAELESELQKLPLYATESSCQEDMKLNMLETNDSTMEFLEDDGKSSDYYQSHGVSPSELDQKLSRLLIEQQEDRIEDLESELHSAQSKLRGKEAELQALKDCVKRLTEFSLSTIPGDDETQAQEQDSTTKWDGSNEVESEPRPVVGMKRPIGSESCIYVVN